MSNKQFYKETFNSLQMSEEAIRKVKNMSENNTKKRRLKPVFRAAIAAASLVVVFAIGNAAVYAATGSSLVEKVSVYINGEKVDVDKITKGRDENGNDYYQLELDEGTDMSSEICMSGDPSEEPEASYYAGTENGYFKTRLLTMDEKTYLLYLPIDDGSEKKREKMIDITEDFKDGKAEGEFVYNNFPYYYKVSGTIEKYKIDIGLAKLSKK